MQGCLSVKGGASQHGRDSSHIAGLPHRVIYPFAKVVEPYIHMSIQKCNREILSSPTALKKRDEGDKLTVNSH
jgi:hypothetical protein